MLDKNDYKQVFDMVSTLAPDFVQSAISAKIAPNTNEKMEYEAKAAYIYAINETMKTLNQMRLNVNPPRNSTNNPTYNNIPSRRYHLDED